MSAPRALVAASLAAACLAAPALASEDVPSLDVTVVERTVTLTARAASLRLVLERVAAGAGLTLVIRGGGDTTVTARMRDTPLGEAIGRLVRWDFTLTSDRLVVYLGAPPGGAVEEQAVEDAMPARRNPLPWRSRARRDDAGRRPIPHVVLDDAVPIEVPPPPVEELGDR